MMFLTYIMIIMNGFAFILYGLDKRKAIRKQWRIPEKVLLGISLFSGVIGSITGMVIFHHKMRKWYFWLIHIIALVLWGFIVYQVWLKPFTFHLI